MKLTPVKIYFLMIFFIPFSVNSEESTVKEPKKLYSITQAPTFSALDWNSTETTDYFTLGKKDIWGWDRWINETNNPALKNKSDGEVFFAYVLGKEDHSSALVRARTVMRRINWEESITFEFEVIQGQIDNDWETQIDYMTELSSPPVDFGNKVVFKTNFETLPSENQQNFDNVNYPTYQDDFLLEPLDKNKKNSLLLADFLPSHLLYSPEDYSWDGTRLKLVENHNKISTPYIDDDYNQEGTVEKIFSKNQCKKLPDAERMPILFIHGWQGKASNAFAILHHYDWTGILDKIKDRPTSGEAYWRNLLTYMYKDRCAFSKYKPYIYHYPTYKHIKFNARMLKELLDSIDDEVIKKGIQKNQLLIIAHSMGTLVSRSLMEEFGYLDHVKQFISLAGVHHGSPGAIESLVDLSDVSNWWTGMNVHTPGACDLMPDNYDGLINQAIKDDIQTDYYLTTELLNQRANCGSIFLSGTKYDTDKNSFDLYYLDQLDVKKSQYYVRKKNMEVPFYPNPWLLNLNKKHQEQYQNKTQNKYYFYAGYVVAEFLPFAAEFLPLWIPGNDGSNRNGLIDNTAMKTAAQVVASQSNYKYLDAVVPLSYALLDTSRGRLLTQEGELKNYNTNEEMPNELAMLTKPTLNNNTNNVLKNDFVVTGTNSWGTPFRIFEDYNHDRMRNGAYKKNSYQYRTAVGNSAHNYFEKYWAHVTGLNEGSAPENHFQNDPLFLQIEADIKGVPPCLIIKNAAHCQGNGQTLTDLTLEANQSISNFSLTGKVMGDANNPARLTRTTILPNTTLNHVIIDSGTLLADEGVVIGTGVRFANNYDFNLIPENIDLSPTLWTNFAQEVPISMPNILDLNDNLVETHFSFLLSQITEQLDINTLLDLEKNDPWQLEQNLQNGQLELLTDSKRYAVLPVALKTAKADIPAGLTVLGDNSVRFVTRNGLEITAQPVIQDFSALLAAIEERLPALFDNSCEECNVLQENGILLTQLLDGRKIVGRADRVSVVVNDDNLQPNRLYLTSPLEPARLVFLDEMGQKREQFIYSTSAYPESLPKPGHCQNEVQENDNTLILRIENQCYQGVFDYFVYPTKNNVNLNSEQLVFTPISENGNIAAWLVIYPTGETQTFKLSQGEHLDAIKLRDHSPSLSRRGLGGEGGGEPSLT